MCAENISLFGYAVQHFQSALIYPNQEAACKWSQLSAPRPCLMNLSWWKAIALFRRKLLRRDIHAPEIPLAQFPTSKKSLKYLSDCKSHRGTEKMKSKAFNCWLPLMQRYCRQEETYLQKLLHNISVVLMKHPPTHHMPRGTTDCFVAAWKYAIKFHSWEVFSCCQRVSSPRK